MFKYRGQSNSLTYSLLLRFVLAGFILLSTVVGGFAATAAQYSAIPPFLSTEVLPNVMFMLDNSGSMKQSLSESRFKTSKTYYGMFEGDKTYKYDDTIEVDLNGYNGLPYDIDADSDGVTDDNDVYANPGAFVEDDSCTIGFENNCWNGSFLNWLTTRRIDAARKVMVGGKVESRDGFDYISGDSGDLEWKIVSNNERSDTVLHRTYSASQTYTPHPDSSTYTVLSPAYEGEIQTTYDPYAKLQYLELATIVNSGGTVVGEYGTVSRCGADAKAGNWCTVSLAHDYTNPVVVATIPSYYGGDPSVVRIAAVDSVTDSFNIRIEEWEYDDGGHTGEDMSYLVFEAGSHVLSGGKKIIAGTVNIAASEIFVDIGAAGFAATPVVLSSVVTNNDPTTVVTRQSATTATSFSIVLQEEEAGGSHGTETVACIALDTGSYNDNANTVFQVGLQTGVSDDWETISFSDTGLAPSFLASMQTTNGPNPAALRYDNLTTTSVDIFVEEETSYDTEMDHADENVGYVVVYSSASKEYNLALIVEEEPVGLLHDISDKVRLGISLYNYKKDTDFYNGEYFHGGTMKPILPLNPFVKNAANTTFRTLDTPVDADIDDIVDAIEHYPLVWGVTPLAENYYEVIRYFQQKTPYYESVNGAGESHYDVNNDWDPYYFEDSNGDGDTTDPGFVPCAQSYVLVFTDGAPYRDDYVPCYASGADSYTGSVGGALGCTDYDGNNSSKEGSASGNTSNNYKDTLDDLALWANSVVDQTTYAVTGDRDLRSDADLSTEQNLVTYTVGFGSDTLKQILVDTASNGGGLSYAAEDGRELKTQLTSAFTDILSRSSGTAASVISNTRSGEGAIYQSVFFPTANDSTSKVTWVGQVHALLVDAYGNMREDTNGNDKLDLIDDYFVVFNEDGTANRYVDGDGNQKLEYNTATCPSTTSPPAAVICYDSLIDTVSLQDLNYIWDTSSWLNEISDSDVETQRSTYISSADARHIFTWVDGNDDSIVDSTEVIDFTCASTPSATDLIDADKIYPYMHLYPSFADRPAEIPSLTAAELTSFLQVQTKRQINYIRGSDCADASNPIDCNTQSLANIGGAFSADTTLVYTAMRSRQFDYDGDSNIETWRLGDIVYSTPTLVGRPSENLHLLYRDLTYASFVAKYKNRRQVVYTGANDGMIHAFNAGFYDPVKKQFCKSSDFTDASTCQDSTKPALGAELWAYVPFNLLPHLYWLTQSSYSEEKHVYYVDQKPRIFDAKIFTEEGACSDISDASCVHPGGWGTVMVIGMNFGGGSIIADMDKTDGATPAAGDPTMKSAFMIFDITNPETEPTLLAEVTMPQMGFATSYPTVIAMRDGDQNGIYDDYTSGENRWYLAFGSGAADVNGDPGTVDTATGSYDDEILDDVKSLQAGQFYLLDLVKLASDNEFHALNSSGVLTEVDFNDSATAVYAAYDSNTFISTPVSADFDLDYNADAVYFGTISGASKPWGGKLRRIVIDDQNNPAGWVRDSVLMDVVKPITAAPIIGLDDDGRHWVFFGTGRYFNADDKSDTNQQSFYGFKEPLGSAGTKDWSALSASDVIDVTDFNVYSDLSVDGVTNSNWAGLLSDQTAKDAWQLNFSAGTGERTLGQAALMGGLLSFTSFIPESDICSAGGESCLWALYYKTGTAHYSGVLGTTDITVSGETKEMADAEISLGRGLATSPNIHVGREKGSSVFVQSSTGEITRIEQENPLSTKSGMQSWKLQD